jgi:DNA polymerase
VTDCGVPPEDVRDHLVAHLDRLQREGVWGLEIKPASPVAESLEQLAAQAAGCTLCKLSEGRTNVVFGVGPSSPRLMFIGEGPGRDEDLQGEPFVGRAGQMLNRIIAAMGLQREEVYIANAVKCRPPRNRNPESDELEACSPFLRRQVESVRPEIIVLLGRVAAQFVLQTSEPLGRLRGEVHEWLGIPVICTYHPAYLLRNPADKGKTWQDMQVVMERLASP